MVQIRVALIIEKKIFDDGFGHGPFDQCHPIK
jgi:hypothetical protein